MAQGRLSEILGMSMVEQDIWLRTLQLYRYAEASKTHLSESALASLQAYSKGINAWLKSNQQLPIEFTVLGVTPEPWTVEDSLSWIKMFALSLSANFQDEIQAYIAKQHLNEEQYALFYPALSKSEKMTQANLAKSDYSHLWQKLLSINHQLETDFNIGGDYVGSNAWVVSGDLTKNGGTILANDPHLGLQIPSLWYAVKQKGDRIDAQGMGMVGLPVIAFGRNKDIAWGGTNMMADVQDLYIEHINPTDPNLYLRDGQWQAFESFEEEIKVRADFPAQLRPAIKDIKIKIRSSVNGPIISDIISGIEQPVSIKWTALTAEDKSYQAFFELPYSKNLTEFKQSMSNLVAPALNLFYIDNVNIASLGVGKIPIRSVGDGRIPLPGSDSKYDWQSYIAFDAMPYVENPAAGFIVNANNDNTALDYPYFISSNFASPYRANQIGKLLAAHKSQDLTAETMAEIQLDVTDLSVAELLPILIKSKKSTALGQAALDYLAKWDGKAAHDSVAATLYYSWVRHLKSELFNDELNSQWNLDEHQGYLSAMTKKISDSQLARLLEEQTPWCDNVSTLELETCATVLSDSLANMLSEQSKYKGSDLSDWPWGEMQSTLYPHMPFSEFKVLDKIFERRVKNAGAVNSINVANGYFDEDEGYIQNFGATFRQIIEINDIDSKHKYVLSTGQSGQLPSPHYDDMVEAFNQGHYYDFYLGASLESTLTLMPKEND